MSEVLPQRLMPLSRDQADRPIPVGYVLTNQGPTLRAGWMIRCLNDNLCWVCARRNERRHAFALSARRLILGVSEEPPAHADCLRYPLAALRWDIGIAALWIGQRYERRLSGSNNFGAFFLEAPFAIEWFDGSGGCDLERVRACLEAEAAALRAAFAEATVKAKADIETRIKAAMRLTTRGSTVSKRDTQNVCNECETPGTC